MYASGLWTFVSSSSSLKLTFFLEITILFLLSLLLCGWRFLIKMINFSGFRSLYFRLTNRKKLILPLGNYFETLKDMTMWLSPHNLLRHLQFFQHGEKMVSKYGYLMLPGAFTDKVTSDIDFTDEAVVQCDVPVTKIFLQVLLIYKWFK